MSPAPETRRGSLDTVRQLYSGKAVILNSLAARLLEQVGDLLTRIEHARLDGVARHPDDLGRLVHRLLMVVDEVDDLAMLLRQLLQALPQQNTGVLFLQDNLRIVRLIGNGFRNIVFEP